MVEPLHSQVEATVVVLVASIDGFGPKLLGVLLPGIEVRNAGLFIQHVGTFANEWNLHSVVLVEMLFVVLNEQLADLGQLAAATRDAVKLDAFDKDLDEGTRLGKVAPLSRDVVNVDVELKSVEAADHHFQNADANCVDVFQHQNFVLLV